MRRPGKGALLLVTTGLCLAAAAVGIRAAQRRALTELDPVVAQLDALRAQVAEDDGWLERNTRVMEGYAQHEEYARRLLVRARRARAHDLLADGYNEALEEVARRFRLLPGPRLPPPRQHLSAAPSR